MKNVLLLFLLCVACRQVKAQQGIRAVYDYNSPHPDRNYYVLKNGNKVGVDSVYTWDYTTPCATEGKILFRDKKTDKVGFFSENGKIAIPAVYNDAQPFYNGLALTVRNAKRTCLDGKEFNINDPCEHWYWKGISSLINDKNEIEVDGINVEQLDEINWYSLKKGNQLLDTAIYINLQGRNGKYYSYINYKKEFKQWFNNHYLESLNPLELQKNCFEEIAIDEKEWKIYAKAAFLKKYGKILNNRLNAIKKHTIEISIFSNHLNPYIYTSKVFSKFYMDCGAGTTQQYPVYEVIVNYYKKNKQIDYQEHFSFLRTDKGYKLIELSLKGK
jgi:hypothetical protein